MSLKKRAPEICPVCDADVPRNAKACPNCGACHESGWRDDDEDDAPEEIDYDALDLPDEAYDDPEEAAAARRKAARRHALPWHWWLTAIVLLGFLYWWFWGGLADLVTGRLK